MHRGFHVFASLILTCASAVTISRPVAASPERGNVSGTVVGVDGLPAEGAQVLVTAIPPISSSAISVERNVVSGSVASDGSFDFTVNPDPDLVAMATSNGGRLNLTISALDARGTGVYVMQALTNVEVGDGTVGEARPVAIRFAPEQLRPGRRPAPESTNSTAVLGSQINPLNTTSGYYIPIVDCYVSDEVISTTVAKTKAGEYHSWDYMSGTWSYGKTGDSEIEAAVSGGSGYQAGGFVAVRNTRGSAVNIARIGRFGKQFKLDFEYVKEKTTMICPLWASEDYRIRATEWIGGAVEGLDVSGGDGPAAANANIATRDCYTHGATWTKNTGKGYLYSAAVSAFGVSLRSTNGYSTNLKSTWAMGSSDRNYFLFGTDARPEGARVVYASSDSGPKAPDCV